MLFPLEGQTSDVQLSCHYFGCISIMFRHGYFLSRDRARGMSNSGSLLVPWTEAKKEEVGTGTGTRLSRSSLSSRSGWWVGRSRQQCLCSECTECLAGVDYGTVRRRRRSQQKQHWLRVGTTKAGQGWGPRTWMGRRIDYC